MYQDTKRVSKFLTQAYCGLQKMQVMNLRSCSKTCMAGLQRMSCGDSGLSGMDVRRQKSGALLLHTLLRTIVNADQLVFRWRL